MRLGQFLVPVGGQPDTGQGPLLGQHKMRVKHDSWISLVPICKNSGVSKSTQKFERETRAVGEGKTFGKRRLMHRRNVSPGSKILELARKRLGIRPSIGARFDPRGAREKIFFSSRYVYRMSAAVVKLGYFGAPIPVTHAPSSGRFSRRSSATAASLSTASSEPPPAS